MTIGTPGKHYIVYVTAIGSRVDLAGDAICYSRSSSTILLPGGETITSQEAFTAVWQEIDGYTNH